MKNLYNISLSDYISLCCGDCSVVVDEGENPDGKELKKHIEGMFFEYKMIVDPVSVRSLLYETDMRMKDEMCTQLYLQCMNLLKMGKIEDARDIFIEASGKKSLSDSYDEREISEAIAWCLKEKEFLKRRRTFYDEKRKEGEHKVSCDEIRRQFAKEKAFVMTFFKMGIDSDKVTAMEYANIVAQADRELKAIKKF